MKISIIIHSKTGNTLLVANKLSERLVADGHAVTIDTIAASNDSENNMNSIVLTKIPQPVDFDALILGAPVRGGKLSPVMQAYLWKLDGFHGKPVSGFVTEFFPSPKMGGNQSIKGMEEICGAKGTSLDMTGVINWMSSNKRSKQITELADNIALTYYR